MRISVREVSTDSRQTADHLPGGSVSPKALGEGKGQKNDQRRRGSPFQRQRLLHHRLSQRKVQGSRQERRGCQRRGRQGGDGPGRRGEQVASQARKQAGKEIEKGWRLKGNGVIP